MLDLRSLESKLASGTVVLNGAELPVRALTASRSAAVAAAFPRPEAVGRIPNPNGGSLAAPIPDEHEPGFQARLDEWWARTAAAAVVLALDAAEPEPSFVKEADKPKWVRDRAGELMEAVPHPQVMEAARTVNGLLGRRAVMEEIIRELPRTAETAPRKFELPKRYCRGDAGVFLNVCERYGIDPFAALGASYDNPTMWALLEAQEVVRGAEGE